MNPDDNNTKERRSWCDFCAFFNYTHNVQTETTFERVGECRRYPRRENNNLWPVVSENDWCGEFVDADTWDGQKPLTLRERFALAATTGLCSIENMDSKTTAKLAWNIADHMMQTTTSTENAQGGQQ